MGETVEEATSSEKQQQCKDSSEQTVVCGIKLRRPHAGMGREILGLPRGTGGIPLDGVRLFTAGTVTLFLTVMIHHAFLFVDVLSVDAFASRRFCTHSQQLLSTMCVQSKGGHSTHLGRSRPEAGHRRRRRRRPRRRRRQNAATSRAADVLPQECPRNAHS